MVDVATWGWYSPTPWPGFSLADQDNLDASGNGLSVDPASYVEFTMRDTDGDGIIYDHDTDDVQPADYSEYVFGPSLVLHPQEIALYTNSTIVIDGVTYTGRDIEVTLFEDGSWGARLMDSSIPPGTHHSKVEQITLGTWNGVEYDGIHTANVDDPFVCFAAQTRIATPHGPTRVDRLRPGDLVLTRERGARPILWVGRRRVMARGRNAPWVVGAGAFGAHGMVMLSPQHRLLIGLRPAGAPGSCGASPEGLSEHLCAIKHLGMHMGGYPGWGGRIRRVSAARMITYVHLLLPEHGLIAAEGLWAESLYPGPQALRMLEAAGPRGEAPCPGLPPRMQADARAYGALARPCLTGREARALSAARGASRVVIHSARDWPAGDCQNPDWPTRDWPNRDWPTQIRTAHPDHAAGAAQARR